MPSSALTSGNSAIVMIDHAAGFGNVCRSHDVSLHVNNTVGLAKTAGVFVIPLVLTNGVDTGPYGNFLTPQNQRPAEMVALAQLTERGGFDLIRHTQVRVR